jgi:hypothetical protein
MAKQVLKRIENHTEGYEMSDQQDKIVDCSSAGKGFARTEGTDIAAENCPLPPAQGKGFARTEEDETSSRPVGQCDCSSAGKGFARTDGNDIAAEDCALPNGPGKGFAKTYDPSKD